MVLGNLPVPGRPTIWIKVGQGPIALAVGAGGGGLDIFTLIYLFSSFSLSLGGGRVVRWCWVNFQCRGVLQFDYSRARAYCACSRCGWGWLDIFTLFYPFSFFSLSLGEARYRLKYCLKGPLNPKQPTNNPLVGRRPDID